MHHINYLLLFLSSFLFVASLASTPPSSANNGAGKLQFNSNGKFKIVQFTDLHFGASHESDLKTLAVQGTVLSTENPDLVVITGDLVSGFLWNHLDANWYANLWTQLIQPMVARNIKWAITLGNHDAEADLTGEQVIALDRTHNLSLTQFGPKTISGFGNYHLPIYKNSSSKDVGYMLWMFDSGQYDCMGVNGYGCIDTTQIAWYKNESRYMSASRRTPIPGMAFFHIPLYEHLDLWNSLDVYGNLEESEGVCCSSVNTGMYNAMKEMNDIKYAFCGHDHKNDYYGNYYGITLGYGKKSGYGNYGPPLDFKRGARVIEISENGEVETWLRLEDKSKVIQSQRKGWPSKFIGCCQMQGHDAPLSHTTMYVLFVVEGVLLAIGICAAMIYCVCKKKKEKAEKERGILGCSSSEAEDL